MGEQGIIDLSEPLGDGLVGAEFPPHGHSIESFVMGQGTPENGGAENMLWRPSQNDSLIRRFCEDEGYRSKTETW